jgi:hypothetical protein
MWRGIIDIISSFKIYKLYFEYNLINHTQKHFLCTMDGPDSSYSALVIHIA